VCALVACLLGCAARGAPRLTEEQNRVRIADGSQSTTLELVQGHAAIAMEEFSSESEARTRGVNLGADVAQLILTETGKKGKVCTYRFWKKK
jgi:hypothetical protein